jgi:hypothetical protein
MEVALALSLPKRISRGRNRAGIKKAIPAIHIQNKRRQKFGLNLASDDAQSATRINNEKTIERQFSPCSSNKLKSSESRWMEGIHKPVREGCVLAAFD